MPEQDSPLDFGQQYRYINGQIRRTRRLLRELDPRRGHMLLDQTVARFLWDAVSVADAIRAVGREKRYRGAEPLIRYLYEIALNLEYLTTHDDPDLAAVHTFIVDLRNLNEEHRRSEESDIASHSTPDDSPPELPDGWPPSVDEAISWMKQHLVEDLGEDREAVDRVMSEGIETAPDHWHWSGTGPGRMINNINLFPEEEAISEHLRLHRRAMWKRTSNRAHPAPRWDEPGRVYVDEERNLKISDPLEESELRAAAQMGTASVLLKSITMTVEVFYTDQR